MVDVAKLETLARVFHVLAGRVNTSASGAKWRPCCLGMGKRGRGSERGRGRERGEERGKGKGERVMGEGKEGARG